MPAQRILEQPASRPWAGVVCYLFGPFGAALLLAMRRFNRLSAVRFHAVHSILFFGFWLAVWSILELAESLSTWFLATVLNEMQTGFNIGGVLLWGALMHAAHQGSRQAFFAPLQTLAARLTDIRSKRSA